MEDSQSNNQPGNQPISPPIADSATKAGRAIARFAGFFMMIFGFVFSFTPAAAVITLMSQFDSPKEERVESTATITKINHFVPATYGTMFCDVSYKYLANDGATYAQTLKNNTDYCDLDVDSGIPIEYLVSKPMTNSLNAPSSFIGEDDRPPIALLTVFIIPFVVIGGAMFIGGIRLLFHKNKGVGESVKGDKDGDGLGHDNSPATEEQMKLIEHGMREIGQFYTRPTIKPTQAEARETLRYLDSMREKKSKPLV